jgi:hypothetical protein
MVSDFSAFQKPKDRTISMRNLRASTIERHAGIGEKQSEYEFF